MVIVVTGSVGSGKTFIAKKLSKEKNLEYLNINSVVNNYHLSKGYDKKRKCKIVDVEDLVKVLIKIIKESKKKLIIDGHLSHYIPSKYVEKCIITKCDISELKKRLKKRGYSKAKIRENLDAEILDVCLIEALEKKHKIKIIDTSPK